MPVVAIYSSVDEVAVRRVLAILKEQGIAAEIRQFHNPWEISWLEGNPWGEILVLDEDAERARRVIEEFLKEVSNDTQSDEKDTKD